MHRITRGLHRVGLGMIVAGCAMPPAPPQPANATHFAFLEGSVTSRSGQPLDSVTVVAWRLAEGDGALVQARVTTDAAGRFQLPLMAAAGTQPAIQGRVVVRGFAEASHHPRVRGRVATDSVSVPVLLAPRGQGPAPSVQASLTLPLP